MSWDIRWCLCAKAPVRSITLFVFGGVARVEAEPPSAIVEIWIAMAGPAVSFILGKLIHQDTDVILPNSIVIWS